MNRRELLRRAIYAVAGASLAAVSRWMPAASAGDYRAGDLWRVKVLSLCELEESFPSHESGITHVCTNIDKESGEITYTALSAEHVYRMEDEE